MTAPFFSVVVPAYNRASMIDRALTSVLSQTGETFEVLVTDDASTDGTAAVVEALGDPRVRLFRHAVNRGVCAARNTALDHARGEWVIMLDSDFELLPGALARLGRRAREAAPAVGNVATTCTWDRGPNTPHPPPERDLDLDFAGYCAFLTTLEISEWFNCYRRIVFERVRFPGGRAYEGGFHLAVMRRWRFQLWREPAVLIHTDADNRITASAPSRMVTRMLRDAPDGAADADAILREHGPLLDAHAPGLAAKYRSAAMFHHLLADHRVEGLQRWRRLPAVERWSPRTIAFLGLGLVGARALAMVQTQYSHWKHRR